MPALVTGGAGYIGSYTAQLPAGAGHETVVLDNLSTGHRRAVRWGPFVEGDLADAELVRAILRTHRIDTVVHVASQSDVGESMGQPGRCFRNNACNTLNLLDAMAEVGVPSIVFSSACATSGPPRWTLIAKDHLQRPIHPYGESKMFVERALRWYGEAYALRRCALRSFNAAGADPDGEIGKTHASEPHLIPLLIRAALGLRSEVEVCGTDFATADGHVRAVDHLAQGGASLALNLGTGQGTSVRQVVETVGRESGKPAPIRDAPRRAGDPDVLVADALLAPQPLGWYPRFRSLDALVETAWRWRLSWSRAAIVPAPVGITHVRPERSERAGLWLVGHGVAPRSNP